MELNKYQEQAMTTCMESSNNFAYMFLNLLGEVGELTEKINNHVDDPLLTDVVNCLSSFGAMAKTIRKEPDLWASKAQVLQFDKHINAFREDVLLQKECGDIEWQLNGLLSVLGLKAEDICAQNLEKLQSRKQRNQIDGNGDNR